MNIKHKPTKPPFWVLRNKRRHVLTRVNKESEDIHSIFTCMKPQNNPYLLRSPTSSFFIKMRAYMKNLSKWNVLGSFKYILVHSELPPLRLFSCFYVLAGFWRELKNCNHCKFLSNSCWVHICINSVRTVKRARKPAPKCPKRPELFFIIMWFYAHLLLITF